MNENKIIAFKKSGEIFGDPLTELLHSWARQLISDAVEVEITELLGHYAAFRNDQGGR